jgi:TonB family protein
VANAEPPAAAGVPTKTVYDADDRDVVAPVAVTQRLPPWSPQGTFASSEFKGRLQILIDAQGNVSSANMAMPAHPLYDAELMRVARQWKFKPATREGVPVPYSKLIDIVLRPSRTPD